MPFHEAVDLSGGRERDGRCWFRAGGVFVEVDTEEVCWEVVLSDFELLGDDI